LYAARVKLRTDISVFDLCARYSWSVPSGWATCTRRFPNTINSSIYRYVHIGISNYTRLDSLLSMPIARFRWSAPSGWATCSRTFPNTTNSSIHIYTYRYFYSLLPMYIDFFVPVRLLLLGGLPALGAPTRRAFRHPLDGHPLRANARRRAARYIYFVYMYM